MKNFLALFFLAFVVNLFAADPATAPSTGKEVIFIPGWLTASTPAKTYEQHLKQVFPTEKIMVMTWKSNSMWKKTLENADASVPKVVEYISSKSEKERAEIILIGHSLGARIAVKATSALAAKNVKIKQVVLLGAAIDYDVDLSSASSVALDKYINVFSKEDGVLKYLYGVYQQKFALGYCGAETNPGKNFVQYKVFSGTESDKALEQYSKLDVADKDFDVKASAILEGVYNHFAKSYIGGLKAMLEGKRDVYTPKYDYSKVKIKPPLGSIPISEKWIIPPMFNMKVIDSYADWYLTETEVKWYTAEKDENGKEISRKEHSKKVYFIIDHYGRIRVCHLLEKPLQKEFNKIKKQIVVIEKKEK